MINFYYGYSIIWSVILFFYSLGFSDLCKPLDIGLTVFLIINIITSFIIGYSQRKKLKFIALKENPHKNKKVTVIFLILFFLEIIMERRVPLLSVIAGQPYNEFSYAGFKGLHILIGASAIMYSFYLSYLFSIFKERNLLYENCAIVFYFCLLVQRQNILICLLVFLFLLFISPKQKTKGKKAKKSILKKVAILVSILAVLYGFGVMGNARYGSSWSWNDTSMIEKLGQINSKYPSFLPKEYVWSYLYLVSPLINLNTNVQYYKNADSNIPNYLYEFVPEFIKNKIGNEKEDVVLPVTSLNASTAFVRVYRYFGYFGMYSMLFVYMLISTIILNLSYKKNRDFFIVSCISLAYVLLFNFFENTLTYSTTSAILIISLIMCFKYKYGNFKIGL